MYPAHIFSLYPPFPRENTVFVAMSFDACFDSRWEKVIQQAIKSVAVNKVRLKPIRVDARDISDSILTEILTGIGNSRLIFADITTIGYLKKRPIRNGNVMYEVGIAQATRLPEEVILFRSDNDELPFDTASVRINTYSPDEDIHGSIKKIQDTIQSSYKEIKLKQHFAVKKATDNLDGKSWELINEIILNSVISHPEVSTLGQAWGTFSKITSINRLLEMGIIVAVFPKLSPEYLQANKETIKSNSAARFIQYKLTEFGKAVFQHSAERLGPLSPDDIKILEEHIEKLIGT